MYRLVISPQAQKELKIIKKAYRQAIKLALEEVRDDPLLGKPLGRELAGRFSYKLGVYRIIYKVDYQDKIINVMSAGHRRKIYK